MTIKLNILEVCTSRSWGGMEMRVIKTSNEFRENGHSVEILCYPDSDLHREAEKSGFECIALPFANGLHPLLILKLRKAIKKSPYDIIHTQYSRDLRFVVPAIENIAPPVPVVLTKRLGSFVNKKDFIHKYLYSRVNLVTAISNVIKQNVIDTCPVDAGKVEVIYNGIDSAIYKEALVRRDKIRISEGIETEKIIVGMVARYSPGKGHEEFLRAAKIISGLKTNVEFWLVGSASFGEEKYEQEIKTLAKEINLSEDFKFIGFRKDVPDLLAAMDILAVPSHAEAFGNIAIEGMAAGKPVVASNTDGLLDIVENEVSGLQVTPKQPQLLADALLRLIEDETLREKMGAASQKIVEEKFDAQKQYKKLEDKFFALAGKS